MKAKSFLAFLAASLLLASCSSTPASSSSAPAPSSEPSSQPESSAPASEESSVSEESSEPAASSSQEESISSEESSTGLPAYNKADHENSLIVHYHRDDGDYETWNLWLWGEGKDGNAYAFNYGDKYGGVAVYPLTTFIDAVKGGKIGVIVRTNDWAKDYDADRFIALDDFVADDNGNFEVWLYTGVGMIYDAKPTNIAYLSTCEFSSRKQVKVASGAGKLYKIELFADGVSIASSELNGVTTATLNLEDALPLDKAYTLKATFENEYVINEDVSPAGLYTDPSFDEDYYYDGDDLGVTYSASASTFKVWSPVSSSIELKLYSTGTPKALENDKHPGSDTPVQTIAMTKGERGVWSVTVDGDLNGKYYTYSVKNYLYPDGKEVVDPYAKAVGVNGLRGEVLDLASTDPTGFDSFTPKNIDRRALTVYETHIADLTSSSTWNGPAEKARLYSGFHEAGTTYSEDSKTVKTGFDHIKELGVNAVQILPMFDQANDETNPEFNWGYNPLNYNAPEGVYSSDPYDGAVRIRELKELIHDYGKAGINIIMDVVYNHVNSVNGLCFDVLMPYYYFRYNGAALYNGSGCGNETASDHSMFSKYMIDSAVYWADEYHLGGFRFDLMGLHDLDTMAKLTAEVKKVNPGAVIYGEPWTGGTSGLAAAKSASQSNQNKFEGYGCFSDNIRDALIAGGLSAATDKAWATVNGADTAAAKRNLAVTKSNGSKLRSAILGAQKSTNDPLIAVSYVSCHDNYTLYDRVKAANGESLDDGIAEKMALLAQSVAFTSQGTAFMLAGEELLRTKGGNSNSYNASYEVNEINYSLKVAHPELFARYQELIAFKQSCPGLHLDETGAKAITVNKSTNYSLLSYEIPGEGEDRYVIIHANGMYEASEKYDIDVGSGTVVYDSLASGISFSGDYDFALYQTLIVKK